MSESITSPEIVILDYNPDDFILELPEDDTLCEQSVQAQNNTPTTPQLPFLYMLIQQAVESHPQSLQRMIAEASPEERAALHTFFLKVSTAQPTLPKEGS